MKIITVNVPDSYINLITEISSRTCASRSELLRIAIRNFLIKEMGLAQNLEKELERIKKINETNIFDYCINCEKELDNSIGEKQKFRQNYELFGLKFCCSCYEKFKDKFLYEFPTSLIDRIKKKIKAYKNYIEKSIIKPMSIKESETIQKLEIEFEKLKSVHFFDYCINCENKLHNFVGKNHKFHKNYEIFELKFCCSCYKKFKDKSFDEFPANLINRIKKKVKEYKSYMEKSNRSNLAK